MRILLVRELKQNLKNNIIRLVILMVCPILMLLLYSFLHIYLFQIMDKVKSLPVEIYHMFGLEENAGTGNIYFYLLYTMMVEFFFVAWSFCSELVDAMYREENNGFAYTIYNQWYKKEKIALVKYAAVEMKFLVTYTVWLLEVWIMLLIKAMNREQQLDLSSQIVGAWGKGIVVISLFLAATFFASAKTSGEQINESNWIGMTLLGTMALGNIYKVKDILIWVLEQTERDIPELLHRLDWMNQLYWFSPLTWLNPFIQRDVKISVVQCILAILIMAGFVILGEYRYSKRSISG